MLRVSRGDYESISLDHRHGSTPPIIICLVRRKVTGSFSACTRIPSSALQRRWVTELKFPRAQISRLIRLISVASTGCRELEFPRAPHSRLIRLISVASAVFPEFLNFVYLLCDWSAPVEGDWLSTVL